MKYTGCRDLPGDVIVFRLYWSGGLVPNGICYPCVMGWGLAGTGNYSAVAAVAAAPRGWVSELQELVVKKHNQTY